MGKRAKTTKLNFRSPICRSAIGQASCLNLHAPPSTSVPALLLNQPIMGRRTDLKGGEERGIKFEPGSFRAALLYRWIVIRTRQLSMAANLRVIRRCRMWKALSVARGVCEVALESASCSLELCSLFNLLFPALKCSVYGSDTPP